MTSSKSRGHLVFIVRTAKLQKCTTISTVYPSSMFESRVEIGSGVRERVLGS